MAEDGQRRVLAFIVIVETASQRQLDAQTGEVCAADHIAFGFLRLGAIPDCHPAAGQGHEGDHRRKPLRLLPERFINGIGEGFVGVDGAGPMWRVGRPQVHHALRIGYRQRTQQHRVHYAEDGGVGADAERERQHRGKRESRAVPQRPPSESHIAQKFFESHPAALHVEALLCGADAAEFPPGLPLGLFLSQSLVAKVIGLQFKMRLDLCGEIVCAALAPEHSQASSPCGLAGSTIRPIARANRRHSLVFSISCSRPFAVRE